MAMESIRRAIAWYLNGNFHRIGGPALEYEDTLYNYKWKKWYYRGMLHRLDGPAIESNNKYYSWYQYGKLHRTEGPAIMRPEHYRIHSFSNKLPFLVIYT